MLCFEVFHQVLNTIARIETTGARRTIGDQLIPESFQFVKYAVKRVDLAPNLKFRPGVEKCAGDFSAGIFAED